MTRKDKNKILSELMKEVHKILGFERWYTAHEAATYLRVNYRTLLNWIHNGKIKYKMVGYEYRISQTELKKHL